MSFEPNVGRVVVEVDNAETKTSGGLYIPGSVEQNGTRNGTVRAVGPTRLVDGAPTALVLQVGDRVILDPLGATKLKIDGKDMVLLRAEDVVGRLSAVSVP